jgi:hypothetical protein
MLYLPRRIAGNLTSEENNVDSFQWNSDQMMFTTVNDDNDIQSSANCAAQLKLGSVNLYSRSSFQPELGSVKLTKMLLDVSNWIEIIHRSLSPD